LLQVLVMEDLIVLIITIRNFSQVTTNTTGTTIVVQYGMSWLWTLNYYGCIHVLYTDNCMAMSQTFSFTGPQY